MFETFIHALFIGWGATVGAVTALTLLSLTNAIGKAIDEARDRRCKRKRRAEARRSAEACGFQRDMRSY